MDALPLGLVAYAYEPRRRDALLKALQGLARVAPWPHGSALALVRKAGQPPLGIAPHTLGLQQIVELEVEGDTWEFGAWQQGIAALQPRAPTAWLLLNDTAGVNDPWPARERVALRRAADELCAAASAGAVLAGRWVAAPQGAALAGQPLSGWVQTHAFVLSQAALRALGGTVFDAALFAAPRVLDGRIELPASVSPALAAHIDGWLTRPGKDGWRWHTGRLQVSDALLRGKAASILQEKRLSAQVLAAGGRLLDCGSPRAGWWASWSRRAFYLRRRCLQALPPRRAF